MNAFFKNIVDLRINAKVVFMTATLMVRTLFLRFVGYFLHFGQDPKAVLSFCGLPTKFDYLLSQTPARENLTISAMLLNVETEAASHVAIMQQASKVCPFCPLS
jgi:hypothetical protein